MNYTFLICAITAQLLSREQRTIIEEADRGVVKVWVATMFLCFISWPLGVAFPILMYVLNEQLPIEERRNLFPDIRRGRRLTRNPNPVQEEGWDTTMMNEAIRRSIVDT